MRPSWTRGVPTPSKARFRSPFRARGAIGQGGPSLILSCSHEGCGILVHDPQGGEEIAKEEEEEGEAAHEHLGEQSGSGREPGVLPVPPLGKGPAHLPLLHSGPGPGWNNASALKAAMPELEGGGSHAESLLETARWTGGSGTTYVSEEEEGQQEGEAPPHPGLEALCRGTAQRGPATQSPSRGKDRPSRRSRQGPAGHACLTHPQ